MAQPIVNARRGLNRLLDPLTSRVGGVMRHPLYRWGGIALTLLVAILLPYWQSQGYKIDAATEA